MTRNIFIIIGLLIFTFVTAMAVKLVLSFSALDGSLLFDLGIGSFNLKYTLNTGVNFGLASQATDTRQILLAVLALLISLGVMTYALNKNISTVTIAAGLLSGGGLSNAYERLAYGGVFDYVNLDFLHFSNPYSFNVADIYIAAGAIILLIHQLVSR